jgi:hypothetical protein
MKTERAQVLFVKFSNIKMKIISVVLELLLANRQAKGRIERMTGATHGCERAKSAREC